MPIAPDWDLVNAVCGVPSPQSTSTFQSPSFGLASVNEPRSNEPELPSVPAWSAGAVIAGGTFLTVT